MKDVIKPNRVVYEYVSTIHVIWLSVSYWQKKKSRKVSQRKNVLVCMATETKILGRQTCVFTP